MTEIKQEVKTTAKPDPNDLLLAEVEVREKDPAAPHRKRSAGEVLFDRAVYTGIGFGVNEASAIVIADEFQNRSGKKLFENISEWMVKHLNFKDTIKNGIHVPAQKNAANMLLWGSLLISGTLLVLPMKMLEDNKDYWVKRANHWVDKLRGNKMAEEDVAARDKEVETALACEAKQTWPSLILGRGIAIVTALGLGAAIGSERSEKMMNWSEKLFTGSIQKEKNRAHSYAAVGALETVSCFTTSIALEIASKLFAKRGLTVRNPEVCTTIVHEKPAATGGQSDATGQQAVTPEVKPIVNAALTAAPDTFDKFKKNPIVKMESHTESVKASETSFSLAT